MPERYSRFQLPDTAFIPGDESVSNQFSQIIEQLNCSFDLSTVNWKNSQSYLWGIDLFNHGFYFEAHEVWEKLWLAQSKNSDEFTFVQGLIQLSVALLKLNTGNIKSAERLFIKGKKKLQNFEKIKYGINIPNILSSTLNHIEGNLSTQPLILLNKE